MLGRALDRALRIRQGPPGFFRPRTGHVALAGDPPSTANAQLVDERSIALGVLPSQILEEPPPLADEHQEPPARVVVFRVRLEVLREAVDALGQQRDLDLGGAGVLFVRPVLLDLALLTLESKRHGEVLLQSPRPRELI